MTWDWKEKLLQLAAPFPADVVQWRPGATTRDQKRAQALAYVDPREYMKRLDDVAGGEWRLLFKPWGEHRIICELSIYDCTRSSTGEFSDDEGSIRGGPAVKGPIAEAQAFKRACAAFGLGRYLYELPSVWVSYDSTKRRLTETPVLPPEYGGASTPGMETQGTNRYANRYADENRDEPRDTPAEEPEYLSAERAEKMAEELVKAGLEKRELLTYATAALGKKVNAFTDLTNDEAIKVWNAAKQAISARKRAS